MSDQPKPNRNLSEISHLFLDSVRERQTGGAPRPVRKPPGSPRNDVSIDLTPEEFAQVFGDQDELAVDESEQANPPVCALISAHLNGRQIERVKEYARHLAASGARVGMIEVDASEFRLMCFDCGTPDSHGEILDLDDESFDPRRMSEALDEMNHDVDQWLLVLPNPRTPEARALLRQVEQWVLLSTCDHDGVVSCYRTLKGLADLHRPVLSLALLNANDDAEAGKVFGKLSSVCQQFLRWPLIHEAPVIDARHVAEHLVMACRPTRDKAQLASAPQWRIVEEFLVKHRGATPMHQQATIAAAPRPAQKTRPAPFKMPVASDAVAMNEAREHLGDFVIPAGAASAAPEPMEAKEPAKPVVAASIPAIGSSPVVAPMTLTMTPAASATTTDTGNDVIDLADGDVRPGSIIAAILAHHAGEIIETPVRAPMCPAARLAVTRDRQLVLVAVAGQGLNEIRSIGQAYRWLQENRSLIAMAVPQFSIDAHQLPRLRLLVDHADVSADVLQPMLQSGNVTVQAYRKLRWGQKTGLLLEAA